jgi:hypothetical protein
MLQDLTIGKGFALSLTLRSHAIRVTGAQGVPQYKTGSGIGGVVVGILIVGYRPHIHE